MKSWCSNIALLLLWQLLLSVPVSPVLAQAQAQTQAPKQAQTQTNVDAVEQSLYEDPQKALTTAEAALKQLPITSKDRTRWEAIAAEASIVLELPEQSLFHAQSGLKSIAGQNLATEIGQRLLISLAVSQRRTGNLQAAAKTIDGVITTLESNHLPSWLLVGALTERADTYREAGNFRAALADLLRAYALADPAAVNGRRGDVAGYLGGVYTVMRDYEHAEQYFREALASAIDNNELVTQSIEEYSLAQVLQLSGRFIEAGKYYKSSREHSRQIDDTQGVAFANIGLAELAILEKRYNQAERLFRDALPVFVASKNLKAQGSIARGLGTIALFRNQYQDAFVQARIALQNSESFQALDPKIDSHDLLSKIYFATGDFALAYQHNSLARELEKTKLTAARDLSVAGMEERFASERREKENESLRQKNAFDELKITEQNERVRFYYLLSALLLLVVVFLIYGIGKNRQLRENLSRLALTDTLTGIANRRSIEALLEQEFIRARRYNFPLSVAMIDLDHFKAINDKFGHDVGDQVLREFCQLVREHLRLVDSFGRWGGEEFIIMLPHIDAEKAALTICRIQEAMADSRCEKLRGQTQVTFSCGLVIQSPEDADINGLVKRADKALYVAKDSGRNRLVQG